MLAAAPTVEPSATTFSGRKVALVAAGSEVTPSTVMQQQYAVELALLEPARRAISQHDYGAALAAIARHQREFPQGELSEERDALRVRALWGAGQKASADRAALDFRKRYPKSGLLSWKLEPDFAARN
jgi:outer membrane protein assembly factor BamD (BamD/ComL family)